jgi:hypothetical protein
MTNITDSSLTPAAASAGGTGPDNGQPDPGEAERILAALVAPLGAVSTLRAGVITLAAAAAMTAAGAGLRLAAGPGPAARVTAAGCAVLICAALAAPLIARLRQRTARGREPGWVAAARVHERSLPARLPATALAAITRYQPALAAARRQPAAHVYLVPCPGNGSHGPLCHLVGAWVPGGRLMVILGEHAAADPAAPAVSLAHELGHVTGWSYRALATLHAARRPGGWGWAAAARGWPGTLTAAAIFQAASLAALWAIETRCDLAAARAEGRAATLAAFAYITAAQATARAAAPRWRYALALALASAAGPSHPPLRLRAAIIRHAPRLP